MKKLTAILLVLVLMFAFSSTALAASGSSEVTFALDNAQISVTVPTTMAAVVKANGDLQFATTGYIENGSVFPVKVTSIVATAETGWTMAASYTSGSDYIVAEVNSVDLLATSPTISGIAWNMTAKDGTDGSGNDYIELAYSGKVHGLTKTLTTTAETAFTVVFTVEAGAYTA